MNVYQTLFITNRGERHQKAALKAAPGNLDITMLHSPEKVEILQHLPGTQFLITEREGIIDADIIEAGKDLLLIQRLGTQVWDINLEAARTAGVPVCTWSIPSCIAVAEHIVMQTLGLLKQSEASKYAMRNARWEREPQRCDEDTFAYNWTNRKQVRSLWQRKFGILGFGETGLELARRLNGFEVEVFYYKRHRYTPKAESELGIWYLRQEELIRTCDIICSLLPFSEQTDQSIDQQFFDAMKPGTYFIHCGSGGVVDENALQQSILSGKLAGAALDTYTWEPLPISNAMLSLAQYPQYNLLLSPHIAAGSDQSKPDERIDEYTNIKRIMNGKKPYNQIS